MSVCCLAGTVKMATTESHMNTQHECCCCVLGVRHKTTIQYATRPDLPKLAYRKLKGKSPGVVFLPGFASVMSGQKAEALEEFCKSLGHSYLR